MQRLLAVPLSIITTAVCWGVYGVVLNRGALDMGHSRLRAFVCVGLAYFVIAVLVPGIMLRMQGEKGNWSLTGFLWSFVAGILGALGALGIILALSFGGNPIFVMPLVFGGAPVMNTLTTMVMTRNFKLNPLFLAGMILVVAGAACVLFFKPNAVAVPGTGPKILEQVTDWFKIVSSILLTVVSWGAYGPILHKGQMIMQGSRLRPLICVGLAYFVIAVVIAGSLYPILEPTGTEADHGYHWTVTGFTYSFIAGSAGAIGALGIILAFTFGGKPVYVMPLVFGGAPIVNTFYTLASSTKQLEPASPLFYSGLMMSIIGAATVLIFAPKGAPHAPLATVPAAPEKTSSVTSSTDKSATETA